MTLDQYLKSEGAKTPAALADEIDKSVSTISLLRDGKRGPSIETAKAIFEATGGAVGLEDWAAQSDEAAA